MLASLAAQAAWSSCTVMLCALPQSISQGPGASDNSCLHGHLYYFFLFQKELVVFSLASASFSGSTTVSFLPERFRMIDSVSPSVCFTRERSFRTGYVSRMSRVYLGFLRSTHVALARILLVENPASLARHHVYRSRIVLARSCFGVPFLCWDRTCAMDTRPFVELLRRGVVLVGGW